MKHVFGALIVFFFFSNLSFSLDVKNDSAFKRMCARHKEALAGRYRRVLRPGERWVGGSLAAELDKGNELFALMVDYQQHVLDQNDGNTQQLQHAQTIGYPVYVIVEVPQNVYAGMNKGFFAQPGRYIGVARFTLGSSRRDRESRFDVGAISVKVTNVPVPMAGQPVVIPEGGIREMNISATGSSSALGSSVQGFADFIGVQTADNIAIKAYRGIKFLKNNFTASLRLMGATAFTPKTNLMLNRFGSGQWFAMGPEDMAKFTLFAGYGSSYGTISREEVYERDGGAWNALLSYFHMATFWDKTPYLSNAFQHWMSQGDYEIMLGLQTMEHAGATTPELVQYHLEEGTARAGTKAVEGATIRLLQQAEENKDLTAALQRLTFNPGVVFPDHDPLGQFGRGRVHPYVAAQAFRLFVNGYQDINIMDLDSKQRQDDLSWIVNDFMRARGY